MNRKEKILWIILVILILMILAVVFVVNLKNEKEDENKYYISKLENKLWICIDSDYYNAEDILIPEIANYYDVFKLEFSDTDVEICIENSCNISPYNIINDTIVIESIIGNKRSFKISFENDYLFLKYVDENGNSQIFKFVIPVG